MAFLAAYGAALSVVILPIVVLELSVGQMTGRAPIQALYNICPTFKGEYCADGGGVCGVVGGILIEEPGITFDNFKQVKTLL